MDSAGTDRATPFPRWDVVASILLAGVATILYFRLLPLRRPPQKPARSSNATTDLATINTTVQRETAPAATSLPGDPPAKQGIQRGVHLRQVYPNNTAETEINTDIDIIAIHGLDTQSPATWTWVDPKTRERINWLQDPQMLPARAKMARIFTCDWPADLFEPYGQVQKSVDELALLLLDGIQRRPPAPGKYRKRNRPILFIASCLGGIILTKALLASTAEGLRKATSGILFLATPFRGTSLRNVAAWAERILKAKGLIRGQEVSKLLDIVKGPTPILEALPGELTRMLRHKEPPCLLFNFYELGTTSWLRKVFPKIPNLLANEERLVDKWSAILDLVPDPLPLNRTHVLMNKFHGPGCPDYGLVAGKIEEMLDSIRKGSILEQADAWIRDRVYTSDRLKIERLSGTQLPMDQCYINLAIVHKSMGDAAHTKNGSEDWWEGYLKRLCEKDWSEDSSSFSLSARLKIETPDEKLQVKLPTLFDQRKNDNGNSTPSPRRIMIRGRAGVGKSTLCKKMIHDFIHHGTWQGLFDRILWVPLRDLKRKPEKGYTLKGLFLRDFFFDTPNRKSFAKELEKELERELEMALHGTAKGGTLFILDGLDEVSEGLERGNAMYPFLDSLLRQPNVIITARPSAALPDSIRPDLELETIGFYPEQVTAYIKKAVTADHETKEIQSFLKQRPVMQGLARIPIQLDALCSTWSDRLPNESTPETMTQLYRSIAQKLFRKDWERLDEWKQSFRNAHHPEIDKNMQYPMHLLELLAFSGLCSDVTSFDKTHRSISSSLSCAEKPLDDILATSSFLRASDPAAKGPKTYHFLHLTFQEYFAARYFVRRWSADTKQGRLTYFDFGKANPRKIETKSSEWLGKELYSSRYNIFWRFVAGLLHANSNDNEEALYEFLYNTAGPHMDIPVDQSDPLDGLPQLRLLMHCLHEIPLSEATPRLNEIRDKLSMALKARISLNAYAWLPHSMMKETELPESILTSLIQERSHSSLRCFISFRSRAYISLELMEFTRSYLKDEDHSFRYYAMFALDGRLDLPESILKDIMALLKDPETHIRISACGNLGSQPNLPKEILREAATHLKDPNPEIRKFAVKSLGSRPDLPEEILRDAAALLKDPVLRVRYFAFKSLGSRPDLPEENLRDAAAKNPVLVVRNSAVKALGIRPDLPEEILRDAVALLKDLGRFDPVSAARVLERPDLPEDIRRDVVAILS